MYVKDKKQESSYLYVFIYNLSYAFIYNSSINGFSPVVHLRNTTAAKMNASESYVLYLVVRSSSGG